MSNKMSNNPNDYSTTHCKGNDRWGTKAPHSWYRQHITSDGGYTTSDRCHNCRVLRINKFDGAVDYSWRMFDFANIP